MLYIGLLLIIIAWILQLKSKGHNILPMFVILYILGTALLALSAFFDRYFLMGLMNLATGVLAFLVYRSLTVRRRR